jgi:hypothetical protein
MTLTTISDLLPHGERLDVFLDQPDVVDVALLMMMNDEELMKNKVPLGSIGQYDAQHSMYVSCGPQDMISLATPSLGG